MKFNVLSRNLLFSILLGSIAAVSSAQNITGRITCEGKGVANVPVSDGYVVTQTDNDGRYAITSDKKSATMFYTVPRGYEPQTTDGYAPQFWAKLNGDRSIPETHNFTLNKVDNDKYTIVVSTDYHLANRCKDDEQFRNTFVKRMKELKAKSKVPVYNTILGDLSWDIYWTSNSYNLKDFTNTMKDSHFPIMTFPVMGNHDNDPAVPAGESCDFESTKPWRTIMAPRYYSYNLGKVHYVVLDNIIYINANTKKSYGPGIAGDRNYKCDLTPEQLEWLKKDLALVDKSATVVVEFHAPTWRLDKSTFETKPNIDSAKALSELVSPFRQAHFVCGHTHYIQNMRPAEYPNIAEHNIAAVCAQWWWGGALSGQNVCSDGTPAGYSLWQVDGDNITMRYMSNSDNKGNQMRVYDMNTVKKYYANDSVQAFLATSPTHTNYKDYADNAVVINVYAYEPDWKIEAFEGKTPLSVKRMPNFEDPFSMISHDMARYAANPKFKNKAVKNTHMFQADCATADKPITIKVTDSYGYVYTKKVKRPGDFSLGMEATQPQKIKKPRKK